MVALESIERPRDLQRPHAGRARRAGRRDPHLPRRPVVADRRPPRPQPRRGRADPGPAPGLRLAARPDRLRHRPPGLRAQDAHRPARTSPTCGSRAACPATRAGPSPSTTSSRTRTPPPRCPRPTASPRPTSCAASATGHVVAVIGDGALTGGMAWEALNNIAAAKDRPLVIVVNDNGRSYAPTIGGLANHLATLRTTRGYERFLDWGKRRCWRARPVVGRPIYETLHGVKKGLKDVVAPQGMFEDLGLKYVGPVDGHDIAAVEHALRRAKRFGGPVIVHAHHPQGPRLRAGRERRGRPVPRHRRDRPRDRPAARRRRRRRGPTSSRDEIVAHRRASAPTSSRITAAMLHPVGLDRVRRARSPTASSTSASPSSTPRPRPPGWPSAGCTRSSPSTRRSSTGPSTRC